MSNLNQKKHPSQNQPLIVVLLGPPGSGKGTQAVRLAKELGIPHISTGDLFRENIRQGTELGLKAQKYIDQGKLGPDELVFDMLFERVSQPDCQKGYILDGVPRTLNQAEVFTKRIEGKTNLNVITLRVSDEILIKRISGRLICKNCQYTYHKDFSPPKEKGICDRCGGELYQRVDDKEEVVRERLRVYHTQTAPVIDFFRKKGFTHEVDGEKNPEEVFAALKKLVKQ